ncbi:MAG TPA: PAS domain-containing protein [Pyrinomonadaceae bacterium]|jgi:PAS domain S-box-containing protein
METPDQELTAEIQPLQGCINNLVEVLALSGSWTDGKPANIVNTSLETLLHMLNLDFVYARLNEMEEEPNEFVRLAESLNEVCTPLKIGELVKPWLGKPLQKFPVVVKNPFGTGNLSIVISPLGSESEFGQIVAASQRPDFPKQTEKLVLDVAANQALIGLQAVRLQKEQKRFAVEHNQDVDERATELAAVSEALKKKIAELKQTEDKLRESERELHLVVDNIPGLVALLSPTGGVEVVNRELTEYFGQTLEELNQWGITDTVHPEDLPHVIENFTRSLGDGTPYNILQRFRRYDGVYRWFENRAFPVRDANGRINRWCVLLTDIHERKHAEDALRKSERQFRLLVETIPTLVWCGTTEGELAYLNQRAVEYLGKTAQSLTGGGWLELVHPDQRDATIQRWLHSATTGMSYEDIYQIRRTDGQYRWIQSVGEPFRDSDGQIACWYGLISDIDEQKRADEALAASERNLKLIIDTIPVLAWSALPDGSADFFNQHYLDYIGFSAEQASGWGWTAALHPGDLENLVTAWKRILAGGELGEAEARMRRYDGKYRWFLFRANPMRDEKGNIIKWYGVHTDIEDRKSAEASLRRNEAFLHDVERLSHVGGWRYDVAGDVVEETPEIHRVYDVQPGDEITKPSYWFGRIHPDDRPQVMEEFERCLRELDEYRAAYRIVVSDGSVRYHHSIGHPVTNDAGELVEFIGAVMDMTEQWLATNELERAYESLRESEHESRLVVDSIPGIIAAFTPAGDLEFINRQGLEYFGKTLEELKRWGTSDQTHPEDLPRAVEIFTRSLVSGDSFEMEVRAQRSDGVYRWIQSRGYPLRDSNGSIVRWYNLLLDIDERKRAEEALEANERNLKLIIDTIPAMAWSARPDGSADFFNQHYLDFVGLSTEQARGWGWTAALHPEDLEDLATTWQGILAGGKLGVAEARMRRYDGEYRWFLFRANPMRDESGSIVKWYGTNTDIDDWKRAEAQRDHTIEELRTRQELLELAQKSARAMAFDWHIQQEVNVWSPEQESLYGLPPGSFDGTYQSWKKLIYPPDWATVLKAINHAHETGEVAVEFRVVWSDGSVHWLATNGQMFFDAQGKPFRMVGFTSDVTPRKLAEEELHRSEAFLVEAQRLSSTGSYAWRPSTNEITWSDEVYRIFEFDRGVTLTPELIGSRIHPDDFEMWAEAINRTREGGGFELDYRLLMPDQTVKYLHAIAHATRDSDGELEYIGAVQDVTAQRASDEALGKLRSELAHMSRVATLGALTASIAHEVNQPLSGIITNASTCLRMLDTDPPNIEGARETARRTIRDGNRASDVIKRLRALFSKKDFIIEPVNLNDAALEVTALLRNELQRSQIVLQVLPAKDLPPVAGDRVQLQQVILNLLLNAVDAMSGVDDRPRQLTVTTEPDGNDSVRLSVSDAGVGFAADESEKLFNAFYTTKKNGMGIGLSVSRSIIERHKGRLWAAPNDGPGAVFSFSIPVQSK